MPEIRLVVVDPGHFHAALVQQRRDPDVSPEVAVYAPLGAELIDYLTRIARYNASAEAPTDWRLKIDAGPDFLDRFRQEPSGAVAIFSGRNRGKIERIRMALDAGMHVLADKPVIIRRDDLPALEAAVATAQQRGVVFCDLMTGRCDPLTHILQGLAQDPEVFGDAQEVAIESVHHIMKEVSGRPNLRPAWYFDIEEQGEGIADIGTHLVDRIHGALFPGVALDWRRDIAVEAASRWPTMLSLEQFRIVTGERDWPDFLAPYLRAGELEYFCNMRARYRVCGVGVSLETRWEWQAPPGGDDSHTAIYTGSRARLELRQRPSEGYRAELYVMPQAEVAAALDRRIAALQAGCPGIALEARDGGWRIAVPAALRLGHDPRFALFARRFFDFVKEPRTLPDCEGPNLLAKYFVCTEAVALARG
jgi:predicted dehydrogenase